MQLDSPLPEESYQQCDQFKGHPPCHPETAKGVVGKHILDSQARQKMLCALSVTGGPITVYSVSLPQLQ